MTVVVETAGIPLKTAGQDAANDGVADTEIRLIVGGPPRDPALCQPLATHSLERNLDPRRPPTSAPLSTVELWGRCRGGAEAKVGGVDVTLSVRPLPAL